MASPNRASASEAPPRRTLWPAVLLVTLAGVVAAFQIGKLPAALPALRAELGLDLVAAGWVISTIAAVGVATGMLWGFLADRAGHRRVLLAGMAVVAAGTLAGSFAETGTALIATRLVEGLGYIAVLAAGPSIVAALSAERDRSLALGVWAFYMPVGLSAMVAVSPAFVDLAGWRGLWRFNAAVAVLALLLAAGATGRRRAPPAPHGRVAGGGPGLPAAIWRTVSSPGPPTLAVCFGAYSLVYLSVSAFLPTFLIERQGYGAGTAAGLAALAMAVNAPGCVLGGWLVRRGWPAARVVALAYLGMLACAFGIFADDTGPALRIALATALPFAGGMIPPAVLDRSARHAASPALVATCVGLIVQTLSLGQLVGPPILASLVSESGSWQRAILLTGPACLVGLAAAAVLARLERPRG